jgi:hypothetical protein
MPEADPFDLASLRLTQDFAAAVGVKRLLTTVPVKKPSTLILRFGDPC